MKLIDKIKEILKNRKEPRKYGISDNGSTVYALDKEAARKKAMELAKHELEVRRRNDI